jgi:hypothetical protein
MNTFAARKAYYTLKLIKLERKVRYLEAITNPEDFPQEYFEYLKEIQILKKFLTRK